MGRPLFGILLAMAVATVSTQNSAPAKEKKDIPPGPPPVISTMPPQIGAALPVSYAWASKRFDGALWGIDQGDVDGDGMPEALLLDRRRVRVGTFDGVSFMEKMACPIPGIAQGARVSTMDLTGDGRAEIIVSAVEEGLPASAIFTVDGKGCRPIVERARWSLRAAGGKLLGQGWSSSSFFFGPISELKLSGGKFEVTGKLDLPRNTRLFQFAPLPGTEEARVVLLKGYAPLEVRERQGGKFKRVWRSPDRFGGSTNLLAASQREVLESEKSGTVAFDTPPIAGAAAGRAFIFSVRSQLPMREIIGRKPGVSGSRVIEFADDPALGFLPRRETVEVPGCIVDAVEGDAPGPGEISILVVTHPDCGMFENPTQSQVILFRMEREERVR